MDNKTTGRGFDSVTYPSRLTLEFTLASGERMKTEHLAAVFGIDTEKENTMNEELKDYILDRLIALRSIQDLPEAATYTDTGILARMDELLLLLAEVAPNESE